MSTIYDLANIEAGDPIGVASEGAREAEVILNQYKAQKEKIEEINEAIEDAQSKANKNKLGYQIGGTLLSSLLTGGIANPWLSGLITAGITGGVEKYRQDRVDATKKLEELKEKYEGSKLGKSIEDTIGVFDAVDEESITNSLVSNVLSNVLFPMVEKPSISGPTTATMSQGADMMLADPSTIQSKGFSLKDLFSKSKDGNLIEFKDKPFIEFDAPLFSDKDGDQEAFNIKDLIEMDGPLVEFEGDFIDKFKPFLTKDATATSSIGADNTLYDPSSITSESWNVGDLLDFEVEPGSITEDVIIKKGTQYPSGENYIAMDPTDIGDTGYMKIGERDFTADELIDYRPPIIDWGKLPTLKADAITPTSITRPRLEGGRLPSFRANPFLSFDLPDNINLPSPKFDFNLPNLNFDKFNFDALIPKFNLPKINLPKVNLPNVNFDALIPNINLPNINLPNVNLGTRGLNRELLGGFFPKIDAALDNTAFGRNALAFMDNNPMIYSLLKNLGPTAYQQLTGSSAYVDPYTMPTFRNPYRGGGY